VLADAGNSRPTKRVRAPAAADINEAAALVGDYMAGRLEEPPWRAFGLSRQPVIGGEQAPTPCVLLIEPYCTLIN
jgi:hypothetical protein